LAQVLRSVATFFPKNGKKLIERFPDLSFLQGLETSQKWSCLLNFRLKTIPNAGLPVENNYQSGPQVILIKSHYLCWSFDSKKLPMLDFWLEAITIAGILESLTHAGVLA
jgi:hypothetical protein